VTVAAHRLEPVFLPTAAGDILLTTWVPARAPPARWLLLVPPFAEELNKSRRMLALLARAAVARGHGVVLPDLAGTGDSWGDFRDARLPLWRADLAATAAWVTARGGEVGAVLGLRFGGLLALELATSLTAVQQVLLWQPALAGNDVLTQFLRLRTAAGLTGGGGPAETVEGLKARLAGGESVEVAGYDLAPELCAALGGLSLVALAPPRPLGIEWFHLTRQSAPALPPPIAAAADRLAAGGARVTTTLVTADAFWSTTEIAVSTELVDRTVARLAH